MPTPPATFLREQVTGLIDRVTFHSPDTGFAVLRVQAKGHRDLITVVGPIPEVRAGERLDAHGRWTIDLAHGQQFRAEVLKTVPPQTAEGMAKYLASGLVKGIGPKLAQRLVDQFAAAVFDVIEQTPERLREVGGIGPGPREGPRSRWSTWPRCTAPRRASPRTCLDWPAGTLAHLLMWRRRWGGWRAGSTPSRLG